MKKIPHICKCMSMNTTTNANNNNLQLLNHPGSKNHLLTIVLMNTKWQVISTRLLMIKGDNNNSNQ